MAENERPLRKARKTVFKQDNRLRLAFIDNKEYGRDIFGTVPKGEQGRWDLYLLFNYFCGEHVFGVNKGERSLVKELESRGYDPSTIYFEITKTKDESKKLEDGTYDCSETASLTKGFTKNELRREFSEEVRSLIEVFGRESKNGWYPSNAWYKLKEIDKDAAERLLDDLLNDLSSSIYRHFSDGSWETSDKKKLIEHAMVVRIYNEIEKQLVGKYRYAEEKYGFKVENPENFLKWLSFYFDLEGKHVKKVEEKFKEKTGKEIDYSKIEENLDLLEDY